MPIPLLLGAAAILAGGLGAVGHAVAKENNEEAQNIIDKAERVYRESIQLLEDKKSDTSEYLAEYGENKLIICSGIIKDYVEITNRLSKRNSTKMKKELDYKQYSLSKKNFVSRDDFSKIEISSMNSAEVLKSGIASLGSGALVSMGTYGGVSLLATASTGTAITSLSGIAATNATMAWLGGGSLAAGGFGMAGGAAMLGGVALGPAILISSIFSGVKSESNLENARLYKKEVNFKISEIERAVVNLDAIMLRCNEAFRVLNKYELALEEKLPEYSYVVDKQVLIDKASFLQKMIDNLKAKYNKDYQRKYVLTDSDKKIVIITDLLVKKIFEIIDTPLIDKDGNIVEELDVVIEEENLDKIIEI